MKPPWGKLIDASLKAGLRPEDALYAVLSVGRRLQAGELDELKPNELSEREADVLEVLAENDSLAAAAARLGISETTVKAHTKNARAKLRVRTTRAAIEAAAELGLIATLDRVA